MMLSHIKSVDKAPSGAAGDNYSDAVSGASQGTTGSGARGGQPMEEARYASLEIPTSRYGDGYGAKTQQEGDSAVDTPHKLVLWLLVLVNIASSAQAVAWVVRRAKPAACLWVTGCSSHPFRSCAAVLGVTCDVAWLQRSIHLMKNHDFFITQIVFPATVNVLCWPVVLFLRCTGRLTPEERATPRWKFAVLALMAGCGNLANAFPQAELPGSLLTVLGTLGTPVLMLLSRVLLGTRYRWPHYVAAALIVGAALVVTLPKASMSGITRGDVGWIVVFVAVMFLPDAIYTEKWMKDVNMSTWYFRANMGLFEVLLGLLLVPTMLIHIPGHTEVPADHLWEHFEDSWRCFRGLPIGVNATVAATADSEMCADSLPVWQVWLLFVLVFPFSIISSLMLTKYGSAVLNSFVSALSVPVTVAFYQWPALAGVITQHGLGWSTVIAIAVSAIGVFLYTTTKEVSKQRQLSLLDDVVRSLSAAPRPDETPYRALHDASGAGYDA